MTDLARSLLNGVAATVATAVASAVGRDRDLPVAAGLLSGGLTPLSSWIAAETEARRTPAG